VYERRRALGLADGRAHSGPGRHGLKGGRVGDQRLDAVAGVAEQHRQVAQDGLQAAQAAGVGVVVLAGVEAEFLVQPRGHVEAGVDRQQERQRQRRVGRPAAERGAGAGVLS
jgi:hypothetical protein